MEANMLAPVKEIFCDIDNFCKQWFDKIFPYLLPNPNRKRQRLCRMSASEIMTIVILFVLVSLLRETAGLITERLCRIDTTDEIFKSQSATMYKAP